MPPLISAHVALTFLTPVPGQLLRAVAQFQFFPAGEDAHWGVLLDGHPLGVVWRADGRWAPEGMAPWLPTRLAAATRLAGALSYARHAARRSPGWQEHISRYMRGREEWDAHRIRCELGLVT